MSPTGRTDPDSWRWTPADNPELPDRVQGLEDKFEGFNSRLRALEIMGRKMMWTGWLIALELALLGGSFLLFGGGG